jgi:hypothetical protein
MPCDASCSSYAKHHFRGRRQKPKVILEIFIFFAPIIKYVRNG